MDTPMGRITCKLYEKQAPLTVANFVGLADGSKDWTDPATGQVKHGVPFYDGTSLAGVSGGVMGGDRLGSLKGVAGAPFPAEKSGLGFERAGRLVMAAPPPVPGATKPSGLTSSSVFYVLDHANREYDHRGGTVFGQCDDASLAVVTAISHALLSTDNHPAAAIGIDHIAVVKAGEPMPAVAAVISAANFTPQPVPMPVAAIPAPEPTGPTVVIDTTMGPLTCKLFKETPVATANFVGLAEGTKAWTNPTTHALMHGKRFYDGLSFRRVVPDFMIQNADLPGDPSGDGDIGFHFANEIVPGLTFDRPGRLAYANAGPDTNESEFFITEAPNHRLDGSYTIFGQCDEASVKVVEAIARVPRDEHNKPLKAVVIRKVSVE
jgi:peptidyl-prolyl cis-trans isomerase A (cyclophilin A)